MDKDIKRIMIKLLERKIESLSKKVDKYYQLQYKQASNIYGLQSCRVNLELAEDIEDKIYRLKFLRNIFINRLKDLNSSLNDE